MKKHGRPVAVAPCWAAAWAPPQWPSALSPWRPSCHGCCWPPVGSGCGTSWAPRHRSPSHWSRSCSPSPRSSVRKERSRRTSCRSNVRKWNHSIHQVCNLILKCSIILQFVLLTFTIVVLCYCSQIERERRLKIKWNRLRVSVWSDRTFILASAQIKFSSCCL